MRFNVNKEPLDKSVTTDSSESLEVQQSPSSGASGPLKKDATRERWFQAIHDFVCFYVSCAGGDAWVCVFIYFAFVFAFNLFPFQIFNFRSTSSFLTLDGTMFIAVLSSQERLEAVWFCLLTLAKKKKCTIWLFFFCKIYFRIFCFKSSIGAWKRIKLNPLWITGYMHKDKCTLDTLWIGPLQLRVTWPSQTLCEYQQWKEQGKNKK